MILDKIHLPLFFSTIGQLGFNCYATPFWSSLASFLSTVPEVIRNFYFLLSRLPFETSQRFAM